MSNITQVHARELSKSAMVAGNESKYKRVIDGDRVKFWVGIGWIDEGTASNYDRLLYPEVIRD
jgi:hypothetical protein